MNTITYKITKDEYFTFNDLYIDGMLLQNILTIRTLDSIYIDYFQNLDTSLSVLDPPDRRYIWQLIDHRTDCNFPILLCDDDMDLTNDIVVVEVEHLQGCVRWKRFGRVLYNNYSEIEYTHSGIRDIDTWSQEDWEEYKEIAYRLIYEEDYSQQWIDAHWEDELYRRNCNYFHKYINDSSNIQWLGELNFTFDTNQYFESLTNIRRDLNL
jgi:hypothetical protein